MKMRAKETKGGDDKKIGVGVWLAAISSLMCVILFLYTNYFDLFNSILRKKTTWFLIAVLLLCCLLARFTPIMRYIKGIFAGEKLTAGEKCYLLFVGSVYLIWAVAFVHVSYGPDEMMRYDIPKYIYENMALPYGDEEVLRNPIWGISYGFLLTLPTVLSAVFMKVMSVFTAEPRLLLLAARFVSILSSVGTAYYAIQITKKIFRTPTRWIFIGLISLIPQIVFLSSYVNNDTFGLFTAVMIVYAWIRGLESQWDLKSCIFLGAAGGMCLVGYTWYWTFVLCSLFVYCASYLRYRKENFDTKRFFKYGLIIIGVALLFCGWIYLRAFIIYDGDLMGTAHSNATSELYAAEGYRASQVAERALVKNGVSIRMMLLEYGWLKATFKSFFYGLGYMSVWAKDWVYVFYGALCQMGILGILIQFMSGKDAWQQQVKRSVSLTGKRLYEWFILIFFTALSGGITCLFSVWRSWTGDYQSQGRYVMAVAPFLFLMIAYAVETIVDTWERVLDKDLHQLKKAITILIVITIFITMLSGFRACVSEFGNIIL